MAFAFEVGAAAFTSFASSITLSVNPGTNPDRVLAVFATIHQSNPTTITGATYNGTAMTAGTAFTGALTAKPCRAFWIAGDANIPTGAHNLVVNASDGNGKFDIVVAVFSGVSVIGSEVRASAFSTTPSWTISAASGQRALALWQCDSGAGALTPGAGTTTEFSRRSIGIVDEFAQDEDWSAGSNIVIGDTIGAPTPEWFGVALLLTPVAAGATAVTLSGPSGGNCGVASTNFTVGVDTTPITGTLIVTPTTSSLGTFTPTTVSLTTGAPTATFTYTPSVGGVHQINVSNDGGLTAPSNVAYTATAQYAYPIADLDVGAWLPSLRNLLTYTEAFDNAAWPMLNASIAADAAVAPDGSTTADKMSEGGGGAAAHGFERPFTLPLTSTNYTWSVYLKPAGRDWARLDFDNRDVNTAHAYFDLVNGVVGGNSGSGGVSYSCAIAPAANGYFRCSITMDSGVGGSGANLYAYPATGDGGLIYAGDGASGLYMWGAQLEQAPAADVYQPVLATTPSTPPPPPLYSMTDEGATPNDADFDFVLGPGSTVKQRITSIPDPLASGGHALAYRAYSPQSKMVQIDVYDSGTATLIKSSTQLLTPSVTQYYILLSAAEADAIVPVGGLYVLDVWRTGLAS